MRDAHTDLGKKHIAPPFAELVVIGDATRERLVTSGLFPPLTKRHGIYLCGTSEARDGFAFVRHRPDFWQLLVCLGGEGIVWNTETGTWQRCGMGQAYVTPPNAPHAYRAAADTEPWRLAWVQLAPTMVSAVLHAPALTDTDGEPMAASIRGLHAESLQPGGGDPLVTESWAALVRAYAMRLCVAVATGDGPPPGDPRLVRLFNEVAADPAYPWTLATLASRIHLSAEHLRRLCRAEGLDAPMRRVTELRMRHAAALLSSGFYTVERAALHVGYDNPFAFSTAFKRVLGRSPSAFRHTRGEDVSKRPPTG